MPAAISNPPAALTTPPKTKPKFITIRVWSGPYQQAFAHSVGAQFTKATGVAVHWDTTDELVDWEKEDQEMRAGIRPDADASMNAQQRGYLDAVRGLTLPISAKVAPNMLKANFDTAAPQGTPKGATTWAYAIPYSVTVSLVVNTKKINPGLLTSWKDLTIPQLRHGIVFDQTFWSTAFPLAKALGVNWASDPPQSMAPVWSYIKKLRPNLAAIGNGQDVTTALTNGAAKVAVTCTCNIIGTNTPNLKFVQPKDGMFMVGDGYYIHKGIPTANYYYAEVFANYLYSAQTQQYLASSQGLVPTVAGTPVPSYMKAQPAVFPLTSKEIKAANGVVAPIPLIARYNASWQPAFEEALK